MRAAIALLALSACLAPVRIYSAQALGNIGPAAKEAVPDLRATLGDQSQYLRTLAAEAINKIEGGQ